MKSRSRKKQIPFIMTIQFRMTAIVLAVMCILILININIYLNVNNIVSDMNMVYEKNFTLNNLGDELKKVQNGMTEYLKTKSTEGVGSYYRHVQEYQNILEELNSETVNEKHLLMEKNIRSMSEAYLGVTDRCIEYKRGRNIENYRIYYEESIKLQSYLTDYIESLNNDIFISNSSSYQELLSVLTYTQKLSVGILVAASFVIIVLVTYATRLITRPLTRLAVAAGSVAGGNLDTPPLEVAIDDEVGVVTNAFNTMLKSIREYIGQMTENMERERALTEKELLMEAHLKEAQLNYLQAQINPHFLFNTLNAGAQLAMMEDADRTYEYIQNVADFYRYKIDIKKTVTLEEELSIVDSYMYIINVRFSGDIKYTKSIDEALTSVLVPSMILQPIVENSVRHGVRDIGREAHIHISVFYREGNVCVSIKDNGVGMERETINRIFDDKYRKPVNGESTGVGLANVISRMRLYTGIENVLSITSEGYNMGTEVAVLIPFEQQ